MPALSKCVVAITLLALTILDVIPAIAAYPERAIT